MRRFLWVKKETLRGEDILRMAITYPDRELPDCVADRIEIQGPCVLRRKLPGEKSPAKVFIEVPPETILVLS